jgi:hypothetical protein
LTGGADPQDDNVVLEKFFHPNFRLCLSLKAQMAADTIQRLEFMPMLRIIYALIWSKTLDSRKECQRGVYFCFRRPCKLISHV